MKMHWLDTVVTLPSVMGKNKKARGYYGWFLANGIIDEKLKQLPDVNSILA